MIEVNIHIILSIAIILCILSTGRSIYFRKQASKNKILLDEALLSLGLAQQKISRFVEIEERSATFQSDLNSAEITTKMQQSRILSNHESGTPEVPERYRYIQSLSEKGVSPEDIAAILSISNHEAKQLVTLANLACK